MKLTENKLKRLVETEIKNYRLNEDEGPAEPEGKADAAVNSLKRLLKIPAVATVMDKIEKVLNSQGDPGETTRKEEILLLFQELNIAHGDLNKVMPEMKSLERAETVKDEKPVVGPGGALAP